jgi:hypothetical protein
VNNRAVLFIDLLGFAKLTEENDLDFDAMSRKQHILVGGFEDMFIERRNPLTHAFTSFHDTLKWQIELAQMGHSLTAITFSDSAFIATSRLSECIHIAIGIMQSLLARGVAARAGIAFGTFATIRFKSDIIGEWGDHAAHFLGTSVIRSNAAERCGIKGIRVLLHPTAVSLLNSESIEAPDGSNINWGLRGFVWVKLAT